MLICFTLGSNWNIQEQSLIDDSFSRLDSAINSVRRNEKTEKFLAELLKVLLENADRRTDFQKALKYGFGKLKRRFPGVFRFTVVSGGGELIGGLTDGQQPRSVVKRLNKLFVDLRKLEKSTITSGAREELIRLSWNVVKSFIGPQASPGKLMEKEDEFFEVSYLNQDRWFFQWTGKRFGIMVHATHVPDWPYLSIRDQCRLLEKHDLYNGIRVGLKTEKLESESLPELKAALFDFNRNLRHHQVHPENLFSISQFSSTAVIWSSMSRSRIRSFVGNRIGITTGGTIFFAIFAFFSFQIMVRGRKFRLPIRMRLLALFLFAGGLPVSLILLSGWIYLNQNYRTLAEKEWEENEQVLRSFDAGFPKMLAGISNQFDSVTRNLAFSDFARREHAVEILRKCWHKLGNPDLAIIDGKGKIVWEIQPPGVQISKLRSVHQSITPTIIRNLNQEQSEHALVRPFSSTGNLTSELVKSLRNMVDVHVGGTRNFQWVGPLTEKDKKTSFILTAYWTRTALEKLYIRKYLLEAQRKKNGLRMLAFKADYFDRQFSGNQFLGRQAEKLLLQLSRSGRTIRDKISLASGNFLVVASKARNLTESLLVALKSDGSLLREINNGRNILWIFVLLSSSLTVFLWSFLSASLLLPISNITSGIRAFELREFEHRIPKGESDELGSLVQLFNGALEGAKDLELAKLVQTRLFPSAELKNGPFSLYGESRMMTQLGGDYFDLKQLSDGRILILIGDVAGHGVPAGLIMAMTKALVEAKINMSPPEGEKIRPDGILVFIQDILFQTIKIKSMLTCFVGILDPVSMCFEYSNAGHNYPYIFRSGLPPAMLEMRRSMPLAPRRRPIFTFNSIALKPDERIIFYTDGLVEANSVDGDVIGYSRTFPDLAELMSDDPVVSYGKVIAWHKTLTGNAFLNDDVTVLILCVKACQIS